MAMEGRTSNINPVHLPPLRPYQLEIGKAILKSVREHLGLTFSVEIARQGGKNELSAQLELLLLILHMERGGNIIKCSPTFKPQSLISLMRLQEKLKQAGMEKFFKLSHGYILSLGRAKALFFSAEPSSHVMGATAHLLLEVDEAQDVEKDKFTRDFKPMAASTNATTVLYGTTWDSSGLLEEVKQSNLELEKADGLKRHFRYDWQEVAKYNSAYRKYVEAEMKRLGEEHPLFLTQYKLLSLSSKGRFFNAFQLGQLKGGHARRHVKEPGKVYVAGLDLAGLADGDGDREGSNHDMAVLAVAEVKLAVSGQVSAISSQLSVVSGEVSAAPLTSDPYSLTPDIKVVELLYWKDEPYSSLYVSLLQAIREVWSCALVVLDATGAGAGMASFLRGALGKKVVPFLFTSQSKSRLGFQFLSFINLGKVKVFEPDGSQETEEFWKEMEKARVSYRPNQTMNFYVDAAEGHDDYLMSLALAVEAANLYKPRMARGSLES